MVAYLPPLLFVLSWIFALIGITPINTDSDAGLDEIALRWMLFLGLGWTAAVGSSLQHTVWAKRTARAIGWHTNDFQYEVGFANLAIGLAAIFASAVDSSDAWVAASIAGGGFLLLAAANHVREIAAERNFAPGNTVILVSDIGVPVSLLALLISVGAF